MGKKDAKTPSKTPKKKEGGGGKAKKKKWSKGKTRDKLNNLVLFDKNTYDKLYKEVPTYKLIKQVVAHSSQMIYTRMIGDAQEDEKGDEGGVVVEKKGKGKKDKSEAKALAKAEAEAGVE